MNFLNCFACCVKERQKWILIGAGVSSPLVIRVKAKQIHAIGAVSTESLGTVLGKRMDALYKIRNVPGVSRANLLCLGRGLGHPIHGPIIGAGAGALAAEGYCLQACMR
jgi:hypothetical protein